MIEINQVSSEQLPILLQSLTHFIQDKSLQVMEATKQLKPVVGCESYCPSVSAYVDCVSAALLTYSFMMEMAKSQPMFPVPKPILEEHFAYAVMICHEFFVKTLSNVIVNEANNKAASPTKDSKKAKKDAYKDKETLDIKAKRSFNIMVKLLST